MNQQPHDPIPKPIYWDPSATPPDVAGALDALAEEYPLAAGEGPSSGALRRVTFEPGFGDSGVDVSEEGARTVIRYGRLADALRGVGGLLSGLARREGTSFQSLGLMLDCSRNAVMKPEHVQRWMRRMALLGYNRLMLYTEDTYALPGEDYFGYLRGGYTEDELKQLDAYASRLGIELIGCIQTLGHLEQMLKWSAYADIRDTASVLLVDEDRTYELIEKMIARCADCYRSRRLHVGMDEAHGLGRGRFMDRHGYERAYDLFNRHLKRVCGICRRHGLEPMIWSDMFFRMGNSRQSYYDPETVIPDEVKQGIPKDVRLVYWDYEHEEPAFYEDWIARHRALGFEPVMASGLHIWGAHLWYGHDTTTRRMLPCVSACRNAGVQDIFFTLWGDDGAYAEYDSALAGVVLAAESAYGGDAGGEEVAAQFAAVCGADFKAVLQGADIQKRIRAGLLLWDDPLLKIYWKNERLQTQRIWDRVLRDYNGLLRRLKPFRDLTEPVDFHHIGTVLTFLRDKIKVQLAVEQAYAARDAEALFSACRKARRMARRTDDLEQTFRRQWMRRNKPHGFETIQIRLGGQRQRWRELAARLEELTEGRIDAIPELDETPAAPITLLSRWRDIAGGGIV